MSSELVITNVPVGVVVRDKELAIIRHAKLWEEYPEVDRHVIYTDGSSTHGKSGAGWVCYDRGQRMEPISDGLPGGWCALECEIWAIYRALYLLIDCCLRRSLQTVYLWLLCCATWAWMIEIMGWPCCLPQ